MARDLHVFAYFMKSARSTFRSNLAQPEGRRARKNFFSFFLGSLCEIR